MSRDPSAVVRYMAELAPVGRDRKLDRQPAARDLVVLGPATRLLKSRTSHLPLRPEDSPPAGRAAVGGWERYLAEEDSFDGVLCADNLQRLADLDELHRGEQLFASRLALSDWTLRG